MNSPWVKIAESFGSLCGFVLAVYYTYWRIRQNRIASDKGLEDNPERCGRHEEAIKQLRSDMDDYYDENREEHRTMSVQLGALSLEIAKLSRNGHGGEKK